jgi:hypothetical protein
MPSLVADCPRCGTKNISLELRGYSRIRQIISFFSNYEFFCVCSHCKVGTIFHCTNIDISTSQEIEKIGINNVSNSLNNYFNVDFYISIANESGISPPKEIPKNIKNVFIEGSKCLKVECINASATMFRLCVDLATRDLVPTENMDGVNRFIREKLGPRLTWLFDNDKLPQDLRGLSDCIKEDGNDGAHEGNLTKEDAEDLLDFTTAILERLYSIPAQVKSAEERRAKRRSTE